MNMRAELIVIDTLQFRAKNKTLVTLYFGSMRAIDEIMFFFSLFAEL